MVSQDKFHCNTEQNTHKSLSNLALPPIGQDHPPCISASIASVWGLSASPGTTLPTSVLRGKENRALLTQQINNINCTFNTTAEYIAHTSIGVIVRHISVIVGLHMGPNNLCYVKHHFLFFPYVTMSLFIRPWRHFLQFLKKPTSDFYNF